jgi:hypothetical protein
MEKQNFPVEDEAYKFATINGLGETGVRLFHASKYELGSKATVTQVRQRALEMLEASKAETEKIIRLPERPVQSQQFRPDDGPDDAA